MVESEEVDVTGSRRIILRPNASLTESQALLLLAAVGIVLATIAAGFAAMGLWLVLPFSGAEWLLLAYCFRLTFRKCTIREIITITEDAVIVETGHDRPEQTDRFQRAWVTLNWARSPRLGHPSRLSLRLHGKEVEVGRFLVETEREVLARELQKILNGSR